MGVKPEAKIKLERVVESVTKLSDILIENVADEGIARVNILEGNEEDPSALVFLDIPSFMSFGRQEMPLFEQAIHEADAMNFFCLPDEWLRITFAIRGYWEREKDPYETVVTELKPKKE